MSQVANCLNCGSKSKVNAKNGMITYQTIQDKEAFKKVEQLKKAVEKFKAKAEKLEQELEVLMNKE